MKTLVILTCQPPTTSWQNLINAIPCLCWGIICLIALIFLLRYVAMPLIANRHQIKMQQNKNDWEKNMMKDPEILDAKQKEQRNQLSLRIDEFNSIEINKLLLSKLNNGDDIKKLREEYDQLKSEFDALKKKISSNQVTLNIKQR